MLNYLASPVLGRPAKMLAGSDYGFGGAASGMVRKKDWHKLTFK